MKTYAQPGEVLELVAPTGGVVANTIYKIGAVVVMALTSAAETEKFSALITGVVRYTKVGAQAWSEGDLVYWDDGGGAKRFTKTSAGNTLAGVAIEAVAGGAGDTTGVVRLDGVVRV